MTEVTLETAFALEAADDGLSARVSPRFSNAPLSMPAERGGPFGGLMAALAARAARDGLAIEPPLRSLTVQYVAAAAFDAPVVFRPHLTRGGRSAAFATVAATQGDRHILSGLATFGREFSGPTLTPLRRAPGGPESLPSLPLDPRYGPWFTPFMEYRFEEGPKLFGHNPPDDPTLRVWVRLADGAPLDEARLCFLLDGVYPTYWTALPAPPAIAASVDLRIDVLKPITPDTAPDGWVFFEYTTQDLGGGWAVEDGRAFARDGEPIALVRQRRKLAAVR